MKYGSYDGADGFVFCCSSAEGMQPTFMSSLLPSEIILANTEFLSANGYQLEIAFESVILV